jgi:hypothetical protein
VKVFERPARDTSSGLVDVPALLRVARHCPLPAADEPSAPDFARRHRALLGTPMRHAEVITARCIRACRPSDD